MMSWAWNGGAGLGRLGSAPFKIWPGMRWFRGFMCWRYDCDTDQEGDQQKKERKRLLSNDLTIDLYVMLTRCWIRVCLVMVHRAGLRILGFVLNNRSAIFL